MKPVLYVFGLESSRSTALPALVAEYRYNGLGYRIAVHADTDTDLDVDGSDLWYYSAYDEGWRMVATYRSSDDDPKERFVHHQAGDGGYGGRSYIDLVAFREKDANTDWDEESDGVLEQRIYYCQNQHADVVSLITSAGGMREMDRYSAYGVPFGLPVGDANSDGKSNSADRTQIQNWINASNHYDVRGDLDLDGDVDLDDKDTLQYTYGVVDLGRGVLSASAVGNRRGISGYDSDSELVGRKYGIRNRVLDAELGRWIRRDPLEYVDGPSLYTAMNCNPVGLRDQLGLSAGICPFTVKVFYEHWEWCGTVVNCSQQCIANAATHAHEGLAKGCMEYCAYNVAHPSVGTGCVGTISQATSTNGGCQIVWHYIVDTQNPVQLVAWYFRQLWLLKKIDDGEKNQQITAKGVCSCSRLKRTGGNRGLTGQ